MLMRSGFCTATREGKATSLRSAPCPATPVRVNEDELDRVPLLIVTVKVYTEPVAKVLVGKVMDAWLALEPRMVDPATLVHVALVFITHVHKYVIPSPLAAVESSGS